MKYVMIFICCFLVMSCSMPETKTYRVRLTFCDSRPPKIITVEWCGLNKTPPSNRDIQTSEIAVPKFNAGKGNIYLNVSQLDVLTQEEFENEKLNSLPK